jgi:hypothetical protein
MAIQPEKFTPKFLIPGSGEEWWSGQSAEPMAWLARELVESRGDIAEIDHGIRNDVLIIRIRTPDFSQPSLSFAISSAPPGSDMFGVDDVESILTALDPSEDELSNLVKSPSVIAAAARVGGDPTSFFEGYELKTAVLASNISACLNSFLALARTLQHELESLPTAGPDPS